MRLWVHLVGWLAALSLIQLGMSEFQRRHWCDLPGWLGPSIHYTDACPYRGKIVVRSLP